MGPTDEAGRICGLGGCAGIRRLGRQIASDRRAMGKVRPWHGPPLVVQEFLPGNCNSREYGLGHTSDIGVFDRGVSPYGCYDMCGNVWEMCEGRWMKDTLPMRGGCFLGSATFVRITCRWTPEDPVNGAHWMGFRCVKEIPAHQ